jgi:hypothetical protein
MDARKQYDLISEPINIIKTMHKFSYDELWVICKNIFECLFIAFIHLFGVVFVSSSSLLVYFVFVLDIDFCLGRDPIQLFFRIVKSHLI